MHIWLSTNNRMMKEWKNEFRKIQYSGKSSFMLALPKKWINEMGLSAGDQVHVKQLGDNSLSVSTDIDTKEENKKEMTVVFNANENVGFMIRKLVSLYLSGYNIINLKIKPKNLSPKQREEIKNFVRMKLVGTEIIEDSFDHISIQVLLNPSELNLKNTIRRMYIISKDLHKNAITALINFNKEWAVEIIKSDDEVDRFGLYAVRQLEYGMNNDVDIREIGLDNKKLCLGYRIVVKSIERISDHATMIGKEIVEMPKGFNSKLNKQIKELSEFSIKILDDAVESMFKKDYKKADEVVKNATKMQQKEETILANASGLSYKELYHLRNVLEHIRRTSDYSADVAEVVMNFTVE